MPNTPSRREFLIGVAQSAIVFLFLLWGTDKLHGEFNLSIETILPFGFIAIASAILSLGESKE